MQGSDRKGGAHMRDTVAAREDGGEGIGGKDEVLGSSRKCVVSGGILIRLATFHAQATRREAGRLSVNE